jgi:hypothetical protein
VSGREFYREYKAIAVLTAEGHWEVLAETVTYEGTYGNDDI